MLCASSVYTSLDCRHTTEPPKPPPPPVVGDTTSHSFKWQFDTLGEGNSSTLYDVVIISDSEAYAVGEIYFTDSNGNYDPNAYNLAKWNGESWLLYKLQFYVICGQTTKTSYPASSITAFSDKDIWISAVDQFSHWNGTTQTGIYCSPVNFASAKVWAASPNEIFVVGRGGEVLRFDRSTWQQIPSPTKLWSRDIWGESNPASGDAHICVVSSNLAAIPQGKAFFGIANQTTIQLPDSGLPDAVAGVWFTSGSLTYVVGAGVFQKTNVASTDQWEEVNVGSLEGFLRAIRGNGPNDIVAVGDFGTVMHFNGSTWKDFYSQTQIDGIYTSVAIKGNTIIAVGFVNSRAIVLIGRR